MIDPFMAVFGGVVAGITTVFVCVIPAFLIMNWSRASGKEKALLIVMIVFCIIGGLAVFFLAGFALPEAARDFVSMMA